MNKTSRLDAKILTISALLIALSVIIPLLPLPKIILGPFSATPASHVPTMLAMLINPYVAICAAIGSALGFLMTLGPIVSLRALSHIIFAVVGYYMLKNRINIFIVIGVTMILHGASEIVVALLFGKAFMAIWLTVGIFTMIHHILDFTITLIIFEALKKAHLMHGEVNYKSLKA